MAASHNDRATTTAAAAAAAPISRAFTPKSSLPRLQLTLLLLLQPQEHGGPIRSTRSFTNQLVMVAGEFSEADCLRCVGAMYVSDNLLNTTYCEVDDVFEAERYDCIAEVDSVELCKSDHYDIGQDCKNEEISTAAAIIVLILLCCCCSAIVAGIIGCVYCCVKSSNNTNNNNHHLHGGDHRQQHIPQLGTSTMTGATDNTASGQLSPLSRGAYYHQQEQQPMILPVVRPGTLRPSTTASSISTSTIATPIHPTTTTPDSTNTAGQQQQQHQEDTEPVSSVLGGEESDHVPFAEAIALDQSTIKPKQTLTTIYLESS